MPNDILNPGSPEGRALIRKIKPILHGVNTTLHHLTEEIFEQKRLVAQVLALLPWSFHSSEDENDEESSSSSPKHSENDDELL